MRIQFSARGRPANFYAGAELLSRLMTGLREDVGWNRVWQARGADRSANFSETSVDALQEIIDREYTDDYRASWEFYSQPEDYSLRLLTGIGTKVDTESNLAQWEGRGLYRGELAFGPSSPRYSLDVIGALSRHVSLETISAGEANAELRRYRFSYADRSRDVNWRVDRVLVPIDAVQVDWLFSTGDLAFDEAKLPPSASVFVESGSGLRCIRLCENPDEVTVEMIDDARAALGFLRLRQIVDLSAVPEDYDGPYILPE